MFASELLNTTRHRPWALPQTSWRYYQEWNDVVFLHWQVEVSELKKYVPEALEIDLFDGKAWVSVVAFTMENIRPRLLAPFPPISNFHEVNIRTYVKAANGKSGVYFLSIEAEKWLSATLAKGLSGLPYRHSTIHRNKDTYSTHNQQLNNQLSLQYTVGKPLHQKSELDLWLTERYALFQESGTDLYEFQIHHLEWSINEVHLNAFNFNYPRFNELIPGPPHIAHYSSGVQVLSWGKKLC